MTKLVFELCDLTFHEHGDVRRPAARAWLVDRMQCVRLHQQPLDLHATLQQAQRGDLTTGIGGVGVLDVVARLE